MSKYDEINKEKCKAYASEVINRAELVAGALAGIIEGVKIFDEQPIMERYGHPKFYELCEEEMDLHSRKNHDYAKGGNPLGNFQRVAKILSLYPNLKLSDPAVVGIVYLCKQFDASLWMLSNGHEAKAEGHKERWQDVSVYAKIISILIAEQNKTVDNTDGGGI